MNSDLAQAIYAAGGLAGAGILIWMVVTVVKTGWAPWDDDEA